MGANWPFACLGWESFPAEGELSVGTADWHGILQEAFVVEPAADQLLGFIIHHPGADRGHLLIKHGLHSGLGFCDGSTDRLLHPLLDPSGLSSALLDRLLWLIVGCFLASAPVAGNGVEAFGLVLFLFDNVFLQRVVRLFVVNVLDHGLLVHQESPFAHP